MATCKKIGYNGSLTVEFVPPLDRTPANPFKNAVAAADETLTAEQSSLLKTMAQASSRKSFTPGWLKNRSKTLRKYM